MGALAPLGPQQPGRFRLIGDIQQRWQRIIRFCEGEIIHFTVSFLPFISMFRILATGLPAPPAPPRCRAGSVESAGPPLSALAVTLIQ